MDDLKTSLERDGFVAIRQCVRDPEAWRSRLESALRASRAVDVPGVARLERRGELYAVRGLMEAWPDARSLLAEVLAEHGWIREVVGPDPGVVRALLFDKAPRATWFVKRHRDAAISVRAVDPLPAGFSHPTRKHGVFHVEAPREFMDRMLTLRIHLDAADAENGALRVLPGSHRGELAHGEERTLVVTAGDVVVMRPSLVHASSSARTDRHRRVVHLELASRAALLPPLEWNSFHPLP